MLDTLHPYFNIQNCGSKTGLRKKNKPNFVVRDDLDKKKSTNNLKKRDNKPPEEAIPLVQREKGVERDHHEEREGTKVKILMTKEEAARLLSKCKEGGVLEFKDVARELGQIPAARVSVVSSGEAEEGRVLGSIPEESSTTA